MPTEAIAQARSHPGRPTSKLIRSSQFVRLDLPPLEELVEPCIVIKEGVTLLAAPSKSGKSLLVLNLALAVTQGKDFLRCHKTRRAKVAYYQSEMAATAVQRRFHSLGIDSNDLWVRNIRPAN